MRLNALMIRPKAKHLAVLPLVLWSSMAMAQGWTWWIPEQLNPFNPRQGREEQDRSNMKVDCSRLDEFVKEKEFVVDGKTVIRKDVTDEKYVHCLQQPSAPWTVNQTEWSPEHERGFSEFVRRLGTASTCTTVDTCMVSEKANPFLSDEDVEAFHYSDCADFPAYLRAYYAYKHHLPFSYLSGLGQRKAAEPAPAVNGEPAKAEDYRYTREGNLPHARTTVLGKSTDFFKWSSRLVDVYHSGMLRMSKWEQGKDQPVAPDFYSPNVSRDSIRPGSVVYDSNGHVAIIYDITENGEIKLIQASPGGHVSRSILDSTFDMDGPKSGSGFKNWRPFKVVSEKRNANGDIISGKFSFAKDEEISDFSMEQYYGHEQADLLASGKYRGSMVRYIVDGFPFKKEEFIRFVRIRFLGQGVKMNLVREVESSLKSICTAAIERRMDYVAGATAKGIAQKPAPSVYPENIYGSSGEWENFSSPGGDARLRRMVTDLNGDIQYYWKLVKDRQRISFFEYSGGDLRADFERAFHRRNYACRIAYRNSAGQTIELTLADLLGRMALLSFDPYHCIERRWGARTATESKSCKDSEDKAEWYRVTQFLRNITSRPSDLRTNKTLREMQDFVEGKAEIAVSGIGKVSTKDTSGTYDVLKVIRNLN